MHLFVQSIIIGVLIVLAVFLVDLFGWQDEQDAKAVSFTTLVLANLGLIFANRSWSRTILSTLRTPNPALWSGHYRLQLHTSRYFRRPQNHKVQDSQSGDPPALR